MTTCEAIGDLGDYANENDVFSEMNTNATILSLTHSASKPKTKSKFGKFLSGMSGTISHSKSSNDIHSHTISGNVSMSVNAASQQNILNMSTGVNKSTSSIIQTSSKKNKVSNTNSTNSMVVSAVRLLNTLTGGSSGTNQSVPLKMPKSFSSFNIKQSNHDSSLNNNPKTKTSLILNTNGNLGVTNNNSKLFIFN